MVQGAKQFVTLKISAGEKGIAKGASVRCVLLAPKSSHGLSANKIDYFVEFLQLSSIVQDEFQIENNDDQTVTLDVKRTKSKDSSEIVLDVGEGLIERALKSGEVLNVNIGLDVLHDVHKRRSNNSSEGFSIEKCTLLTELTWRELENSSGRNFTSDRRISLSFESPVEVAADLELHSKWNIDDVSSAVGLDGTPLGDGGTLLCSIHSRTAKEEIEVRKVSLETPTWLELRPDKEPPHASLLPCCLQPDAEFMCAFDIFVREGALSTKPLPFDVSPEDALKDRLSRLDRHAEHGVVEKLSSADLDDHLLATPRADGGSIDLILPDEAGATESAVLVKHDNDSANDVVDLTSADKLPLTPLLAQTSEELSSLAVLRIELRIPGVVGWTTVQRKVSMVALRGGAKRYGVQRHIKPVGEVGKVMDMDFRIWCIGATVDDERPHIQYEVDADPNVWTVVGQKRGSLRISAGSQEGGGGRATAKVLPVQGGTLTAPNLTLFEHDGTLVSNSRCDAVAQHAQVIVTPSRAVVSACRGGHVVKASDADVDRSTNMPLVISSNRLFRS